MSVTPAFVCLSLAMSAVTLEPGNCPPSPGLAPWATFICISSAERRYAGVTPNLPEATCFILEFNIVPYLEVSSPPSPELLLAPIVFIASARHSCASGDIEPILIAADENLLNISDSGSTLSILIGSLSLWSS